MTKARELADLIANVNHGSSLGNKNFIINGAMEIYQRGTSFDTSSGYGDYTLDRWMSGHTVTGKFSIDRVADAPAGLKHSLKATSASAYSVGTNEEFVIRQKIEGENCIPLALGTASAKTVTLSFWVKSSLTGTFSGAFLNSAEDRCYVFTYAISSASTWEKKEVTVALDTSGTWVTSSGIGLTIYFSLGAGSGLQATAGSWISTKDLTTSSSVNLVGTNAATWFITGVQLEIGKATAFEHEPNQLTLNRCLRYFNRITGYNTREFAGYNESTTKGLHVFRFAIKMRGNPTIGVSGTVSNYIIAYSNTQTACNATLAFNTTNPEGVTFYSSVASGLTAGGASCLRNIDYIDLKAEL